MIFIAPFIVLFTGNVLLVSCSRLNNNEAFISGSTNLPNQNQEPNNNEDTPTFAAIDFSNWKITLPVDEDNNGSPDEYKPSALGNGGYRTNTSIKYYMCDDIWDSSLVFYTLLKSSTTNSSYSKKELRELINVFNIRENWTLAKGGEMSGRIKVKSVSKNNRSSEDYYKITVMQIHGIICEEDMATHGFSLNNRPPLIKTYWKDSYALLETSNNTWADIKINLGHVGFEVFNFRIKASNARIEV